MAQAAVDQRIQLNMLEPHEGQNKLHACPSRYLVAAMGRRYGKTEFAKQRAINHLTQGHSVGYFAASYKLQTEVWREMYDILSPIMKRANASERRMETITGGVLEFWTLENEDAGRSRKYHHVIIDEAGLVPKLGAIWEEAIRPTLADYRGSADFIGTPKGRNFFWQVAQFGSDPFNKDWRFFQAPTWENIYIPRKEIDCLKPGQPGGMTDRAWRQEILAEFLEDGGMVFRLVREAVGDCLAAYQDGKEYYAGLDLGKTEDYTVLTIMDGDKNVVACDRYNRVSWSLIKGRIVNKLHEYGNPPCYVDSTGVGDPIFEDLAKMDMQVQSFKFTNDSKAHIVEGLAIAFEQGEITIPSDEQMIGELEAFESEVLPSGRIRYQHPEGHFDDHVDSLCLANHAVRNFSYADAPGLQRERLEQMFGHKITPVGGERAALKEQQDFAKREEGPSELNAWLYEDGLEEI